MRAQSSKPKGTNMMLRILQAHPILAGNVITSFIGATVALVWDQVCAAQGVMTLVVQ